MTETPFDLIQQALNTLLRAPNVRSALTCDIHGKIVTKSGSEGDVDQEILQAMASSVLPATKRIAEKSGDVNEAQSISLPEDDLHLLVFWLAFEYFLIVSFSKPINPYSPPQSVIKTCDLIRRILQSEQKSREVLSSKGIDLETEVYIEQLLHSKKIIKDSWYQPNPDKSEPKRFTAKIAKSAKVFFAVFACLAVQKFLHKKQEFHL